MGGGAAEVVDVLEGATGFTIYADSPTGMRLRVRWACWGFLDVCKVGV